MTHQHRHIWRRANPELLTTVAELIRDITNAPPEEWQDRVRNLADALDQLADDAINDH